ncbi:hypothetical protein OIV83_005804 [Microbotryomycetes sp. JL201]|nr:hypothetical protein OIV83_005804 [Microbotryomycetes sp. JL201]
MLSALPVSLLALLTAVLSVDARPVLSDAQADVRRLADVAPSALGDDYSLQPVSNLISYFPRITSPVKDQVWLEGQPVDVACGTAPPFDPAQIPQTANITLGFLSAVKPGFNLDIAHPLATVQLYQEPYSVTITLPTNITTRDTYLLILGSSGNTSPLFTIVGTGPPEDVVDVSASTATERQIEARPITYVIGGDTTVIGRPNMGVQPTLTAPVAPSEAVDDESASTASATATFTLGSSVVIAPVASPPASSDVSSAPTPMASAEAATNDPTAPTSGAIALPVAPSLAFATTLFALVAILA